MQEIKIPRDSCQIVEWQISQWAMELEESIKMREAKLGGIENVRI